MQLDDLIEVVGVFDTDPAALERAEEKFGLKAFQDFDSLCTATDAVDIVTPTTTHLVLAKAAIEAGCHVFVEKPVTSTAREALELEQLANSSGLIVQVGHVERFNPAFAKIQDEGLRPVFVEAHRLAQFNPRSTDVSVVLDLMIHDLDLVLALMPSGVERVSASGVGVVGESVDIANARIDFVDGSTANLTASRISMKAMRKLRLFQRDAYISLDLLEKQAEVFRLGPHDPEAPGPLQLPTDTGLREVVYEQPEIPPSNAILEELREFATAILTGKAVTVDVRQARQTLELAERILADIDRRRTQLTAQTSFGVA